MRIVFDTNIFIAAALKGGFAEDIIELAENKIITLLTSTNILEELEEKLRTKFNTSEKDITFFLRKIKQAAKVVTTKEKISIITRDPEDNKILECAVTGKADLTVSADQDLIKLKQFRDIAIIHPKTLSYTFPKYFKKKN
jgi:putative PIN family toxin of toxin-antitoxin system